MLITYYICRILATIQVLVIYSSISYFKSKKNKSMTFLPFSIIMETICLIYRLEQRLALQSPVVTACITKFNIKITHSPSVLVFCTIQNRGYFPNCN